MPFIPVPNAAAVEIRFLLDGQHIENTLGFERADAVTEANLTDLNGAVTGWWLENMAPLQPTALQLVEVVCTDLTTDSGPQVTIAPATEQFGLVDSPALPNNVSLCVSFRTGHRGRSSRGRNYIPALWEAGVVANTVGGTIVTAFAAAYTELITDTGLADAGWTWVVISRFSGVDADHHPIPREEGTVLPVTSVTIVDPIVDSMRRRLPGRGT